MRKTFAICRGATLSNQFMARGLGTKLVRRLVEVLRYNSLIQKLLKVKSEI